MPISTQSRKKFLSERRAMFSTAVPLNFSSKAAAMFSLDRERNRLNKRYARLAAPSANRKSQWRGNTRIAKHPTANPHRVAADASLVVNEAPINFQTFLYRQVS
jgi:hypothetical protein